MGRSREKYNYEILMRFRDGYQEQAGDDFDTFVRYLNLRREDGTEVKTKFKHKSGDQQFDEFLIIVR